MSKESLYPYDNAPLLTDYLRGLQTAGGPNTARFLMSDLVTLFFANSPMLLAKSGNVTTNETTTSSSYTDLSTVGPSVNVTIGTSGIALLIVGCDEANSTTGAFAMMGWSASGANTIATADEDAFFGKSATANSDVNASLCKLLTGLTPGATTFTAKYRVTAGTGSFAYRKIAVIPY